MELRHSCGRAQRGRQGRCICRFSLLLEGKCFLAACLAPLVASGCGAPGEPTPPVPPIAAAVTDLKANQAGDGVQLVFTMPVKSVAGDKLAVPPAVEIVRGAAKADGSPDAKTLRVVSTIPGALVANYISEGHVRIIDPIAPTELRANSRAAFVYLVRTRPSRKRVSANSNAVSVQVFPVPERLATVQATVTESAIELSWTAPVRTSAGDPLRAISGFHVYRGELEPSSAATALKDPSEAKWKVPLALLAPTEETKYSDTVFDFGKTYAYVVRSVIPIVSTTLESSDSAPAIVTPRDTFPPAAPQNLTAAVLPGATPDTLLVDLSWSINLETDLAGYRVYRSEQHGTKGELVSADLLPAPAYRDTSVVPGRRYWYSVTAVDRAGNESEASSAVAVEAAKPSS